VKSKRVRLVAVALLLVVLWAGFFVRDASFVLSVFGRFAGSPYLLGFTMFPLWSLAALVAAVVLLFSFLVDARTWPIWIVAAVLVGAMLLLRGLRFSVSQTESAGCESWLSCSCALSIKWRAGRSCTARETVEGWRRPVDSQSREYLMGVAVTAGSWPSVWEELLSRRSGFWSLHTKGDREEPVVRSLSRGLPAAARRRSGS